VPAVSQSWSLMRLRLCADDLRSAMWTIFDENSTPMVCEERTRPVVFTLAVAPNSPSLPHGTPLGIVDVHSSLTNRCKTHDLNTRVSAILSPSASPPTYVLSSAARPQQDNLGEVIIHAAQLLLASAAHPYLARARPTYLRGRRALRCRRVRQSSCAPHGPTT
jgi:hypothetical protein